MGGKISKAWASVCTQSQGDISSLGGGGGVSGLQD